MPYRRAPYYLALLIALAGFAFWRDYLGALAKAPGAWHLHGITATIWLALLALQSWSIHERRGALHRALGAASLFFFPVFLAGGMGVVQTMSRATASGDIFYVIYGTRLGTLDLTSVVVLAWLFHQALSQRRNIQLHARYMMATPLFLVPPTIGRIFDRIVPGLIINGPQDFFRFAWAMHLADLIPVGIAWWLWRQSPRHGRPFVVVGAAVLLQGVMFETIGRTAIWAETFAAIGRVPTPALLGATIVVAAVIVRHGWVAAARPSVRSATA